MGLFHFSKKHDELERILARMQANKENNYKDAAQQDLKEFAERFLELSEKGKLSAKQKEYYGSKLSGCQVELKGYSHKDQKPYWTK